MSLVARVEHAVKKPIWGCQMCGQCVLHSTGLTCPMTCPKTLRNGPCGGVRANGNCEVKPEMRCVWLKAVERSERLPLWRGHVDDLRPPVDNTLKGTSSWLNLISGRDRRCRPAGRQIPMSLLERKLAARELVVTAELPVIDGGGKDEIRRQLEPMEPYVDAFNATDNPSAHAHCSPLAVSIALREAGVEPIMQLVCRDRNRLALEADLIGASMHGVENISCLTGDDVTAGDEPEARRVFDVDSVQLVSIARSLGSRPLSVGPPDLPRPALLHRRRREPGRAAA